MAHIEPTSLTRLVLNEQESVAGHTFNSLNLAVLQNLIADSSETKINLEYDPTNPVKFAQDEAFIQGQLKILRYLIQMHEESQESYMRIKSSSSQED